MKEKNNEKLAHEQEKEQVLDLQEHIIKNPVTSNPEQISPFEYATTERITQ